MSRRCCSYHGGSVVVIAVVLVGLSATAAAADRAARFAEYDARRTQALEKKAESGGLEGALARFYLNEDVDEANRIVMETDFAKVYWANNTVFIPLYQMFNADTGSRGRLLSREATDKIRAYFWHCFQPEGKAGGHIARHYHFFPDRPWLYWGNQNHGFVYQTLFYTAARVLKDAPEYARQFDPVKHVPLGQGVDRYEDRPELAKITLADYAERARRMWRNRLRWMARQGLWAEDMIYRLSNVEGTYNLAYHADDPVIRKRAEMILDLHWLLYALQTVDGQFGGAQNRFKPHYAGYHPERGTGWYYFGGRPGTQPCTAALLGDYLPPEIAYRLLEQPDKRGCFVYREPLFASKTPSAPQANGSRTPSSAKLGPLGAVMLPTAAALATLALLGATSAGPTSDPIRAQALTRAPAPTEGKPRACVGAYYFDGWAGTHPKDGKADWARNAPTHLTERLATEFADREPLWGWRDDTLPIMERQIDLAADHGLAFFAFCWYWHETEKAVRDDPKHTGLRLFLNASNNGRMRFCLLVANHAGFEIQGETAWRRATALWMPYLTHPRSLRVGGKPLLIVFNPAGGDKAGLDYLQQAARKAGLPGVAVAGVGQAPRDMGYTHTTYYSVVPGWEKGLEAHKYREFVEAHKASWRGRPDQPHIPCLSVGWDRRPWEPADPARGRCCWYYPDRTPEEFAAGLRDAVEWIERHPDQVTPKKLMVLYAWNEYGEGGYLVPTRGDPEGAYLKALRSVLLP